jgi:hypothetical protein
MTRQHAPRRTEAAQCATLVTVASLTLALPGCTPSGASDAAADPRVGLKAGLYDAGHTIKGLELVSHENKPDAFHPNDPGGLTYANSDLAFGGHYAYQGNFSGTQIWDIADPAAPKLVSTTVCATSQGDPSIYGHLLFVSAEGRGSRLDCGTQGVDERVSKDRMLGIRIFDVSDPAHPKQVADVQTCRGSHTHTVVPDPKDKGIVYIYVSGLARVRSDSEMPGCESSDVTTDPHNALFRIEVIRVPLAHPEQAKIVSSPRIFNDLVAPEEHGESPADSAYAAQQLAEAKANGGFIGTMRGRERVLPSRMIQPMLDSIVKARGGTGAATGADSAALRKALPDMLARMAAARPARPNRPRTGPSQCHDITVYPAMNLAAGACSGYGLLLDITDPLHPVRLQAVADTNFTFWHSATFSNDGLELLFTDEWGGGTQPKCRATDPMEWGADAIFSLKNDKLTQEGYFKMPAAQTQEENCVAHNGGLVPVPGRTIMVQGWYQGGISVFDWTDPAHPKEIAYFDRGPIDSTKMVIGGYWGGYFYNGYIYGSEIARGLDILKLTPTADLTQNEIDAASLVHFDQLNPQSQPKLVWPAAFPVARAYLDQLVRDNGLPEARTSAIASALNSAEKMSGTERSSALEKLAGELDNDASSATDATRVRALADVVRGLENAAN